MGQRQRPRPRRLAFKVRQIRLALDLTQEQMAGRLQYIESPPQPGHISEFENGRREPSLIYLLAVARLAGVPLEVVIDDDLDLPEHLPTKPQEWIMRPVRLSKR